MNALRKLGSDLSGSIAIEFALLGPLLVLLVAGFVYFASMSLATLRLNTAVAQTALMLGENNETVHSDAELRDLICSFAKLSDCTDRLAISVELLNEFGEPRNRGAERSLTMKVLTARDLTGSEINALSRLVFGDGSPEEIRASALFVTRDG